MHWLFRCPCSVCSCPMKMMLPGESYCNFLTNVLLFEEFITPSYPGLMLRKWICLLTIIPRVRASYNHLISNKREWNNCFIKNVHKISRILHDCICKNNRFSAFFNFEQTRTVTIYIGSYTLMAKPIRVLELHYPIIQF